MFTQKTVKHVLKISDLTSTEITSILSSAKKIKSSPLKYNKSLKDKTLLMLFEKPSLRTRVSFEIGMTQLGGHGIFYSISDSPLGEKETFSDTGIVLSRYADCIMARVKSRNSVNELSKYSNIPVINGLDDWAHPCQMLADFLTIDEYKDIKNNKLKMCYIGDVRNNVTYDLMRCASLLNIDMNVCGPVNIKEYEVEDEVIKECNKLGGNIMITDEIEKSLNNCDIIYTDSWMSYGISKKEEENRIKIFNKYQVDDNKLNMAKNNVIFMNCLPAMRGMEQTASVIDGNKSVVFDQAENRLHAQKALLLYLINGHMDPI